MKYSLGPVLWYWPTETLADFYQAAAESSAEIVYLGESVCSKRRATRFPQWLEFAHLLQESGKQVVFSTLALVQSTSELQEIKRYVDNGEFLIEANDLGTVNMAAEQKLPFVVGHALNCYNAMTLRMLLRLGMTRWCMPVELSRDWLLGIQQQCDELGIHGKFETEVLVRLSPENNQALALIDRFRANEQGQAPLMMAQRNDCNGYWRKLAGMALQS